MSDAPIRVIVHDPTNDDFEARDIMNDYMIIAAGTCQYTVQTRDDGTHIITVTGRGDR